MGIGIGENLTAQPLLHSRVGDTSSVRVASAPLFGAAAVSDWGRLLRTGSVRTSKYTLSQKCTLVLFALSAGYARSSGGESLIL